MEPNIKDGTVPGTLVKSHKLSFTGCRPGDGYGISTIPRPSRRLLQDSPPYIRKPAYPLSLAKTCFVYNIQAKSCTTTRISIRARAGHIQTGSEIISTVQIE